MSQDNITLSLSVDQINLVLGALAELPFRTSADMINEVRTQAQSQLPQAAPEVDSGGEAETAPAPRPRKK